MPFEVTLYLGHDRGVSQGSISIITNAGSQSIIIQVLSKHMINLTTLILYRTPNSFSWKIV